MDKKEIRRYIALVIVIYLTNIFIYLTHLLEFRGVVQFLNSLMIFYSIALIFEVDKDEG